MHRRLGGEGSGAEAFLQGVAQIPGEIVFVKIEGLRVDVAGDSAIVSGIQKAQVTVEGNVIDDPRAFVDMFVRLEGEWRLRVAIDLNLETPGTSPGA